MTPTTSVPPSAGDPVSAEGAFETRDPIAGPSRQPRPESRCPCCAGADWEQVFDRLTDAARVAAGEFAVWRCRDCGVGRTWPIADDTSAYYGDTYGPHSDVEPRSGLRWRLAFAGLGVALTAFLRVPSLRPALDRAVSRALPVSGRELLRLAPSRRFSLLDVGCGSGGFLRVYQGLGIGVVGVDPSARAVRSVRELGIACHEGTIESLALARSSFDVVRFCHVLEHVPDPYESLAVAARILAPGGRLVIRVPAWDSVTADVFGAAWGALDIPRHLWHFTLPALVGLVGRLGFEPLVAERLQTSWLRVSLVRDLVGGGATGKSAREAVARESAVVALADELGAAGEGDEWLIVAERRDSGGDAA